MPPDYDRNKIKNWINESRFRFNKWGSWMIGHEPNTCDEHVFDEAKMSILIFRLSPYFPVSSSMTQGLLSQISREADGVFVDFGFMPHAKEADEFARNEIPPLFGTTSKRSCYEFDIVAFSNSVAQELINLPWLIYNSGITFDYEKRIEDEDIPLLITGGANAMSSFIACKFKDVEDKSAYSLTDALYFGEAELCWKEILEYIADAKAKKVRKKDILNGIAENFSSFYVPFKEYDSKRSRYVTRKMSKSLIMNPLWYNEDTLGKGSISIDAGCPNLCAFCKEAWESRPYRMRDMEAITRDMNEAKVIQGLDSLNIFSFNATSHRELSSIIENARNKFAYVYMKSQRFDNIVKNPDVLRYQQESGKTNFTFGLEGISERLRAFLKKGISEKESLAALKMILDGPVRQIKIFIIITGLEDDNDWLEFDSFLAKLVNMKDFGAKNEKLPVVISATPMISMPNTPMQFKSFPEKETIIKSTSRMRELCIRYKMIFRESIKYEEARFAQLLLFAGGNQMAALVSVSDKPQYYSEISPIVFSSFEKALDSEWLKWALGEKKPDDSFVFDVLFSSGDKEKLYSLYLDSLRAFSDGIPEKTMQKSMISPGRQIKKMSHMPETEYWFAVEADEKLSGIPLKFFQVALARALGYTEPRIAELYRRTGRSFFNQENIPVYGLTIFSLFFNSSIDESIQGLSLPSQWGWKLKGKTIKPFSEMLDVVLIEIKVIWENEIDAQTHFLGPRRFSDVLQSSAVQHSIRKREACKAIIVNKNSVKKAGFYFILWDYEKFSIKIAIMPDGGFLSVFRKLGIFALWKRGKNLPEIIDFLAKDIAGNAKCPACRLSFWRNAFNGEISEERLCPNLCMVAVK